MLTKYIGLISQTRSVSMAQVLQIAAAIQKQLTRDFLPLWNIPANIQAFNSLDDMPTDYWPIIIMDDIDYPGAAGIHLDSNGQPYSLVQAGGSTSLTVSHEALEMIVDPFGDRFVAGDSVKTGQGRVNYLVEICDPSESETYAYTVNGILVSDFYTSNYMDPVLSPGVRYSYSGAITRPREVLPGGYLSWMFPETGEWWQLIHTGAEPIFKNLGKLDKQQGPWREIIDSLSNFNKTIKKVKAPEKGIHPSLFADHDGTQIKQGKAIQIKNDVVSLLLKVNRNYSKNQENIMPSLDPQSVFNAFDPMKVIRMILEVAPSTDLTEETLEIREFKLERNLRYTNTSYFRLFGQLTSYILGLDNNKKLKESELNACTTVGEVVDLVEKTLE
jgi:hypothetical protein